MPAGSFPVADRLFVVIKNVLYGARVANESRRWNLHLFYKPTGFTKSTS